MPLIMETIATHHQTVIQGIKTHYIKIGGGRNFLVFLHGWGGNANNFFPLALDLHQKRPDLQIIIPDYPGFGLTTNPPKKGFSSSEYADWVQHFCNELDIKETHFYTHSNGGRILVYLMEKYPTLGNKLIFTASSGIKWPYSLRQKISIFLSKIVPKFEKGFLSRVQKLVVTKVFGARDWGNVAPQLKTTLEKILAEPDFRKKLPSIKNECLILWGKKDQITPLKSGKVFAEKIPNNKFHILETGRHGIHHTHQDEIVDLVTKFL